eukprot:4365602-Amphidinium_carterae.2
MKRPASLHCGCVAVVLAIAFKWWLPVESHRLVSSSASGIRPRALEVRLAINAEHARRPLVHDRACPDDFTSLKMGGPENLQHCDARLAFEIAASPDAAKLRPGSPPRMPRPASRGKSLADAQSQKLKRCRTSMQMKQWSIS